MERRKFTRKFKLEAVRLIKERGVSYTQASQDLGVIILTAACSIIQHFCIEPIAGEISWSAAGPMDLPPQKEGISWQASNITYGKQTRCSHTRSRSPIRN
jgi:hypothetical protein